MTINFNDKRAFFGLLAAVEALANNQALTPTAREKLAALAADAAPLAEKLHAEKPGRFSCDAATGVLNRKP